MAWHVDAQLVALQYGRRLALDTRWWLIKRETCGCSAVTAHIIPISAQMGLDPARKCFVAFYFCDLFCSVCIV